MTEQSTPIPLAKIDVKAVLARTTSLERGQVVAGYKLGETLSRGSFGTVWRAVRLLDSADVAIKFLHPFLTESAEAIGRLEREARAISTIVHPNVVEVHEFGRLKDGRPFIVMELLEGRSLFAEIRDNGPLSVPRTLEILDGVCAALIATHSVGIIHRDIKASNVFLVDGKHGEVRAVLLDYGLAKILEGDGPELSSSRATLGTPSAMSPEQIRSEKVTTRTDIYALGALTYHMLTGAPAFFGASRSAVLQMHLSSPRPRPSARGEVPVAFDDVVMRAMSRDPAKRYSDAMAFLARFATAARRHRSRPRRSDSRPPGPPQALLGVFLDLKAPVDELSDPSDEMLDDFEHIESIASSIFGAHGFEVAARRGASTMFSRLIDRSAETSARGELLGLINEVQQALRTRINAVSAVTVGLAVDLVPATLDPAGAIDRLLESLTAESTVRAGRPGVIATPRFFGGLAPSRKEPTEDTARLVHDSEM